MGMGKQSAFILALGFTISAIIFGEFFIFARNEKSIRVVGQGVKSVTSDVAKWNITISKDTTVENQNEGPKLIQKELL